MKYPNIKFLIERSGPSGNAFWIIGKIRKEMVKNGVPAGIIANFINESTSGDYEHLLSVCQEYVDLTIEP